MKYNFQEIEQKWQDWWRENDTYKVTEDTSKEKYYVLDMFPYPSGAGLHVGHPLGYIASDVYSRYKRLQGFNVLHPMGYDAFGLPAEQYAIQTGQHPAKTTEENIATYRRQLDQLGFSFDWTREVRTSDPNYYKWTQWVFLKLFDSWYNKDTGKAEPISTLRTKLAEDGNATVNAHCDEVGPFSAEEWEAMTKAERNMLLLNYRLAYLSEAMVNWCSALGTVLANDEVKDGVSERGGHPVIRKKMKQWSMRITAYSQRLLDGLDTIDWSDSMKEMQRNWIGRSEGASVRFTIGGSEQNIEVFTTRPDTIFGATFMVLAPEHELVQHITNDEQKTAIEAYVAETSRRSERDRMADVKTVTGCFTGVYAINPFTEKKIPVWIADYVLAGYGTGAIMAVPSGDERDWRFATEFGLDIIPVIEGQNIKEGADERKEGTMINSGFMDGMQVPEAIKAAISKIEEQGIGKGTVNYKQRDAVFGRQRYWGEPIPIYYDEGVPYPLDESELPLVLPEVDKYLPTEDGEPPLARATDWKYRGEYEYEHTTMPGWAGSSWYYLRYMDAKNDNEFIAKDKVDYWGNVDLYIGGAEHATGHLLYVRFWTKMLFDLGLLPFDEPAKKLINQGMIQGQSMLVRVVHSNPEQGKALREALSKFNIEDLLKSNDSINTEDLEKEQIGETTSWILPDDFPAFPAGGLTRIPVEFVEYDGDIPVLRQSRLAELKQRYPQFGNYYFAEERSFRMMYSSDTFPVDSSLFGREYVRLQQETEKMSKSKYNVVSPDDIITDYGADTLRLYEMFLGPLEDHKPWNMQGIEGTHRFLKKLWRLFENGISEDEPTPEELKVLHRTIKKVQEDIERYSFNTVVSEYMICTNELAELKCNKRAILEPLVIILSPYAPHIAEELWHQLGHETSVCTAIFPTYDEQYLVEDSFSYPVQFNGKVRFTIDLPTDMSPADVEKEVLAAEQAQKYLEGKPPKKVIVVPGRIVNVVV